MKIKDGRILLIMPYPALTALVAKQPNEGLLPLFHHLILVCIITPLAPVCRTIRLTPPIEIIKRPLLLTARTSLDFHISMCILSSTSG